MLSAKIIKNFYLNVKEIEKILSIDITKYNDKKIFIEDVSWQL